MGAAIDEFYGPVSTWPSFRPTANLLRGQIPLPEEQTKVLYGRLLGPGATQGNLFQDVHPEVNITGGLPFDCKFNLIASQKQVCTC